MQDGVGRRFVQPSSLMLPPIRPIILAALTYFRRCRRFFCYLSASKSIVKAASRSSLPGDSICDLPAEPALDEMTQVEPSTHRQTR